MLVAAGTLVSVLVGKTARLATDAQRARAEAATLASVAGRLSGDADPLRAMLAHLRITFDQDAVALFRTADTGAWVLDACDGHPEPDTPRAGEAIPVGDALVLALVPGVLSVDDRRVLDTYAERVAEAVERRELEAVAGQAEVRHQADELRVAILRAVPHDLRRPLASIKASSTSLLQRDIAWTPDQIHEFAETIDQEADGVVFHTDKGGEYHGEVFVAACESLGVTRSMGRVGSALDNALAESFNSTLEWELLSRRTFETKNQARREIATFIDNYNHRRRHSSCETLSPVAYEAAPATRATERAAMGQAA